jgi:hypothetical protein
MPTFSFNLLQSAAFTDVWTLSTYSLSLYVYAVSMIRDSLLHCSLFFKERLNCGSLNDLEFNCWTVVKINMLTSSQPVCLYMILNFLPWVILTQLLRECLLVTVVWLNISVTLGFKFKPLPRTEGGFIDVILKSFYNLQRTETGSLWRDGVFDLFVSYRHSVSIGNAGYIEGIFTGISWISPRKLLANGYKLLTT